MDTESVLRSLNVRGVRYVVIGASAFPAHGYGRTTLDLDVLIEPTSENAERTRAALTDLGYDVTDVSTQEMLAKKILFRQYVLDLDIHPDATGVTFAQVWKNKVRRKFRKTFAFFASLDDLIKMKRAANRPKDREDLKALRAIKRLQASKKTENKKAK